jgi:predicted DNA-binding transcriptional regulator AlpA
MTDRYIDQHEAARLTGFTKWAFEKWRYKGGGPPYRKVRSRIRYRLSDVLTWMERRPELPNTSYDPPPEKMSDGSIRVRLKHY